MRAKMKSPSFTEQFAPKHEGVAQLAALLRPPSVQQLAIAALAPASVPERPKTFIEFYLGGDIRSIYDDMRARPDHYDDRQKQVIEHLMNSAPVTEPVTDKVRELTSARHKQEQAENDAIVMEDGRTLTDHLQTGGPSFEKQDFGDKIII
jgi:hypothetical protein